jgi:hypothetical protein
VSEAFEWGCRYYKCLGTIAELRSVGASSSRVCSLHPSYVLFRPRFLTILSRGVGDGGGAPILRCLVRLHFWSFFLPVFFRIWNVLCAILVKIALSLLCLAIQTLRSFCGGKTIRPFR